MVQLHVKYKAECCVSKLREALKISINLHVDIQNLCYRVVQTQIRFELSLNYNSRMRNYVKFCIGGTTLLFCGAQVWGGKAKVWGGKCPPLPLPGGATGGNTALLSLDDCSCFL